MPFFNKSNINHMVMPGREGDQYRVESLEQQVVILSSKAAGAMDRVADLEAELKMLRNQKSITSSNSSLSSYTMTDYSKADSSIDSRSSTSSFMTGDTSHWKGQDMDFATLQSKLVQMSSSEKKLKQVLEEERQRREDAEKREAALCGQIEDLSSSLFEEANKKCSDMNKKTHLLELKLSAAVENEQSRDKRLHSIEIAINAIKAARSLLNSPRLHSYI